MLLPTVAALTEVIEAPLPEKNVAVTVFPTERLLATLSNVKPAEPFATPESLNWICVFEPEVPVPQNTAVPFETSTWPVEPREPFA